MKDSKQVLHIRLLKLKYFSMSIKIFKLFDYVYTNFFTFLKKVNFLNFP